MRFLGFFECCSSKIGSNERNALGTFRQGMDAENGDGKMNERERER